MSEIKTLEIPKWGLSMEEGTIAQWLIQEGTAFSKGDEICEIETTKIVNVLEAPFDSKLRKIVAKEGDTLIVGGIIAICADSQVSDVEIEDFVQSLAGSTPSASEAKPVEDVTEKMVTPVDETKVQASPVQNSAPKAIKPVAQAGYLVPATLQGYQQFDDIFTTPHALKLAEKHNVNLAQISGSGREGRISVKDIQLAVQAAGGSWPDVRHQS
ncbi:MAG: biotin/lipoyl-containing protein, partial [Acinetobacter sp.]